MSHLIIGTAGHVDHGKTSLIRRLTGIETDRLKEEKERGLSIELGFAYFKLPSGRTAGIVDVPGHERFIKNMLAGAYGMDLVLLVIAADEGVMPQTVEHLAILQLLEVRSGIIVVTKVDRVDSDWLQLIEDDVRNQLAGTFLADAPMVKVSSETGEGFDTLIGRIDALCANARGRPIEAPFRMPIDRVFTIEGFGTVVTGTAVSGRLEIGHSVEVLPQGRLARVRNLQVHEQESEIVEAGQRVAINLSGVTRTELERGDVVAEPGVFATTATFDARLTLLLSAPLPLKDGAPVRLYLGSAELLPRAFPIGAKKIEPGASGFVRFRFETPVHGALFDRFVIRSYSPMTTIGGGVVLDINPTFPRKQHAHIAAQLDTILTFDTLSIASMFLQRAGGEGLTSNQLVRLTGLQPSSADALIQEMRQQGTACLGEKSGRWIHGNIRQAVSEAVLGLLAEFHKQEPLQQGMPKEKLQDGLSKNLKSPSTFANVSPEPEVLDALIAALERDGKVAVERDSLRLPSHRITHDDETARLAAAIERRYLEAQFNTPDIATVLGRFERDAKVAEKVFYSMINVGTLIKIGDLVFHKQTLEIGKQRIQEHLKQHDSLTVADFRNLIDSSRKYAVPLLEYYDKIGVTRRVGDVRVLKEGKKE